MLTLLPPLSTPSQELEKLATTFLDSEDVLITKLNGEAFPEYSYRFGVRGFPTIFWFPAGADEPTQECALRAPSMRLRQLTSWLSASPLAPSSHRLSVSCPPWSTFHSFFLSFFHTIEQSRAAIPEANVAHPSAHSFLRYWGDRHASALMNWIHGKLEEPNPFKVCAPHDIQHVLRQPPEDECCPVFCLLITMTG